MIYLQLFWAFVQIGLFSIGGGYAALPLIQSQVVEQFGWLSLSEFTDILTIAEMTPGPIALNAATFVGIRMGGIPGALTATLGCILPSCVIVLLLGWFYMRYRTMKGLQGVLRGLRPGVIAMIASVTVSMLLLAVFGSDAWPLDFSRLDFFALGLLLLCFGMLRWKKPSTLLVMAGAGLLGALWQLFSPLAIK